MSMSRFLLCCAASAYLLPAQPTPPAAYTITQTNSMMGSPVEMTIYRDGSKVLIDQTHGGTGGKPVHVRSLYNLQTHTSQSWDLNQPEGGCSNATFSGDWGDPYAMSGEISKQNAKETGADTVNGISTRLMEASYPGGKIKAWMEPKSGLVVRAQMIPSSGPAQTVIEVSKLTIGAPPASVFALPPACAAAANAPHAPTEQERIASETGASAADFANAIMGSPSQNSCAVDVRIMRAGSMQPIAAGFQIALDNTVNLDHPASYRTGIGADGKATFAGGGIHEMTGQLRNGVLHIENPPPYFHLSAHFGKGGDADALIYRQCFGQQTALLFVVKNPDKLSDGGDWLWVKSGKYAASSQH